MGGAAARCRKLHLSLIGEPDLPAQVEEASKKGNQEPAKKQPPNSIAYLNSKPPSELSGGEGPVLFSPTRVPCISPFQQHQHVSLCVCVLETCCSIPKPLTPRLFEAYLQIDYELLNELLSDTAFARPMATAKALQKKCMLLYSITRHDPQTNLTSLRNCVMAPSSSPPPASAPAAS